MMSTPYARNGHAVYDEDPDWQASLDYANDQERWPQTPRTPCANPDCDQLCVSLFCSESCREATEGPDHDDALACEGQTPTAETSSSARGTVGVLEGKNGHDVFRLPEAPVSMNVHIPVGGRDVLVTLRGTDEREVLARLERLLARYPVEAPRPAQPPAKGVCTIHNVAMKLNEKEGRTWYSHKVGDDWCKGKAVTHG